MICFVFVVVDDVVVDSRKFVDLSKGWLRKVN